MPQTSNRPEGDVSTGRVPVPDIDPATATDEEKLAWVKARAANEPWQVAIASVAQDMQLMDMPLNPDLLCLAMGEAMTSGEAGVRRFVDGLTTASGVKPAGEAGRG